MKKYIIKTSGQQELFDIKKFRQSLKKAGAPQNIIDQIAQKILDREELKTTHQIYAFALKELKKINRPLAARYNLKQALFDFGPSGFPFEQFVAQLLQIQGYETKLNQFAEGFCVIHEIDLMAHKDSLCYLIECKFHNRPGTKSDIKTALYVYARYLDVQKKGLSCKGITAHAPWLITNTQVTSDALRYAQCVDMHLTSWSYPVENSLAQMIDRSGLHPITCLTSISAKQKKELLDQGLVLCKDVKKQVKKLKAIGIPEVRVKKIVAEAQGVCAI